jgi:ATP-dependent Clp protease ATP-binding subunit ClpA
MLERFGTDARKVLVDAKVHAQSLGHNYVGGEHLLLALCSSETPAGEVLRSLGATPSRVETTTLGILGGPGRRLDREALSAIGIDLDVVRRRVEADFGPGALNRRLSRPRTTGLSFWRRRRRQWGPSPSVEFPLTPRAKQCLERSLRRAQSQQHPEVGVDDVAITVVSMADGLPPRILSDLGVPGAALSAKIADQYRRAG